MNTNTKWLVGIGILVILAAFALPFFWHTLNPMYGYGMMGGGFMPMRGGMMNYGYGFGFGLMWLVPVALLTLIGLGIAALIKYLRA